MRHRHQPSADRSETVAAQQVESQCPQQSQHLHPIALGVLAELGVAGPVPLVFDRPALAHKPQQRLWAGAQGGVAPRGALSGDEQVDVVKRLAVTPSGAHQLDDPAGAHPAHTAAVAGLDIADLNRKVPVAAELGGDLPIQPALVCF